MNEATRTTGTRALDTALAGAGIAADVDGEQTRMSEEGTQTLALVNVSAVSL